MSLFILSFCLLITDHDLQAQEKDQDSLSTPFRKGRWMTGLNGSFSSNSVRLGPEEIQISNNQYGISVLTGTFFADRWFAGISLSAQRANRNGAVKRDYETLFVGPTVSRYFLKDHFGSLYLSLSPSYVRVRDEVAVETTEISLNEIQKGPGLGLVLRLGYSYEVFNNILLDVALVNSYSWLDVEITSNIEELNARDTVVNSSTSFSFGFLVILDEFFF